MAALLLIKATGIKKGRVTSIFRDDEDPGSAVRANVNGQWRFVFVPDADPEELQHLLKPEFEPIAALPEGVPPRMIAARRRLFDVDTLPVRGQGDATKFPARATDAAAYRLPRGLAVAQERANPAATLSPVVREAALRG